MTKDEREQFQALMQRLDEQDETIKELRELLPTLKALTEAWESAGWFARAIKWLSGIVAAMGIIAVAIRYGISHK